MSVDQFSINHEPADGSGTRVKSDWYDLQMWTLHINGVKWEKNEIFCAQKNSTYSQTGERTTQHGLEFGIAPSPRTIAAPVAKIDIHKGHKTEQTFTVGYWKMNACWGRKNDLDGVKFSWIRTEPDCAAKTRNKNRCIDELCDTYDLRHPDSGEAPKASFSFRAEELERVTLDFSLQLQRSKKYRLLRSKWLESISTTKTLRIKKISKIHRVKRMLSRRPRHLNRSVSA